MKYHQTTLTPTLFLSLALLTAVAPFAIDMYLPSFPTIAKDLNAQATAVQLTLTAFLFGLSIGQIIIGPLSDKYGRRKPLMVCLSLYFLASIACIFVADIKSFIFFRALQGLMGAGSIVIARAVVADIAKGAEAARAFSILSSISGFAPVIAPLAGSALVPHVGWRGIMAALAILGLVMLTTAYLRVPESLTQEKRNPERLHHVYLGMKPIISNKHYLSLTLAVCLSFGSLMSYVSASPFVYQNVLGIASKNYAFFFAGNAIGLVSGSMINNQLLKRFSPWQILWTAQRINLALAVVLLITFASGIHSPYIMAPLIFVFVMTMSFILGNGSALAVQQTPHAIGTGSAILGSLFFMFGAAVSPLTGLAGTHAAWPMALTQTFCAILSLFCLRKAHKIATLKAQQVA